MQRLENGKIVSSHIEHHSMNVLLPASNEQEACEKALEYARNRYVDNHSVFRWRKSEFSVIDTESPIEFPITG